MLGKRIVKALLRSPALGNPMLWACSALGLQRGCRFLSRYCRYRPSQVALPLDAEIPGARSGWMWTADGRDQVALQVWQFGPLGFEPPLPKLFAAFARRARRVLVVGANSGFYVLLAALANARVQVNAFEPYPEAVRWLRRNVRLNRLSRQVEIHECAIGGAPGRARLLIPEKDHGLLETSASLGADFWTWRVQPLDVPVATLDQQSCADGRPDIDLILMDVEGQEHEALAGAPRLLTTVRPLLVLEVLPQARLDRLNEIKERFGYDYAELTGTGLRRMQIIRHVPGHANHLLFPPEKHELVRECSAAAGLRLIA
jgi:FkbM family methyltransferase